MVPPFRDGDDEDVVNSCVKDEREELKSEHDSMDVPIVVLVQLVVVVEDDDIDENDPFDSRISMSSDAGMGINSSKSMKHVMSSSSSSS